MATTNKAKGSVIHPLPLSNAQALLDNATMSAATRRNYKSAVKRINAYALKRKRAVDPDTIIAFIKYRVKKGVSASAINLDMAAINHVANMLEVTSPINKAAKDAIHAANKKANAEARGIGRASDVDMKTAEAACVNALKEKSLVGTRDAAMILSIVDALLHPKDITNLNVGDYKDGVIVIRGDKKDDDVEITIQPRTAKAINNWMELIDAVENEPLFKRVTADNEVKPGRLYKARVVTAIKHRLLDAGAPERASAFSLRRLGCIEYIKGGGTINELAERGRLRCENTLMRYAVEAAADK